MSARQLILGAALSLCCGTSSPLYAQSAVQTLSAAVTEAGAINGAAFRIEIPPNWNKGLVMYAHGYRMYSRGGSEHFEKHDDHQQDEYRADDNQRVHIVALGLPAQS